MRAITLSILMFVAIGATPSNSEEVCVEEVADVCLKYETKPKTNPAPRAVSAAEAIEKGLNLAEHQRHEIQQYLRRYGHYKGSIDAVFGPGTRSAIRKWQKSEYRRVTGFIDRRERDRILSGSQNSNSTGERGQASDPRFAAICARSGTPGEYTISRSALSLADAERQARKNTQGCKYFNKVSNGICLAVANNLHGPWAISWSKTSKSSAEEHALTRCRRHGGSCKIIETVCTSK